MPKKYEVQCMIVELDENDEPVDENYDGNDLSFTLVTDEKPTKELIALLHPSPKINSLCT